jgi:hypothetical protein
MTMPRKTRKTLPPAELMLWVRNPLGNDGARYHALTVTGFHGEGADTLIGIVVSAVAAHGLALEYANTDPEASLRAVSATLAEAPRVQVRLTEAADTLTGAWPEVRVCLA